jgi:twinkle protein
MKDPNEMLLSGKSNQITQDIFNAQEFRPDKICTPSELLPRILERPNEGVPWPWKRMTDITLGCREKQLILVGAAPGVGKTELVKDIMLDMAYNKDTKSAMFSFEQDAADTLRRLIGGIVGKPLHLPQDWWDEKVIKEKANELDNKVYIYDNWGGAKVEDIVPKMRYLAKACNVKLFIIDHLTAIAARLDGDERRGIEKVMEMLASLSRELKCCIILVSHLSRDKKKGDETDSWGGGRKPVLENFKGSGAIEAWAYSVLDAGEV